MKVGLVLFGFLFMVLSCENKHKDGFKREQGPIKDTLEGDFIINQLDLGKLQVSFLDKFQKEKDEFKSGDTFYVDAKYLGEPQKLRDNHEILVNQTSENLQVLKQKRNGEFTFVIEPVSKGDTVRFELIIKSDKYIFKHVKSAGKNKLEDTYKDYLGLALYFIKCD